MIDRARGVAQAPGSRPWALEPWHLEPRAHSARPRLNDTRRRAALCWARPDPCTTGRPDVLPFWPAGRLSRLILIIIVQLLIAYQSRAMKGEREVRALWRRRPVRPSARGARELGARPAQLARPIRLGGADKGRLSVGPRQAAT